MALQILKKRIGFWVFACLLSHIAEGQQQKVWTLQACIKQATEANINIQQKQIENKLLRENYLQSKAAVLPSVNGSFSNSWQTGFAINPETNSAQKDQSFQTNSAGINANLNLFNGFQNSNNIRLQAKKLNANKKDLEQAVNNLQLSVCNAYLAVLQNIELKESAKTRVEAAQKMLEKQEKMYELGNSNKARLLQLKAEYSSQLSNLVNAENACELSYLELFNLLNIQKDSTMRVASINDDTYLIDSNVSTADVIFERFVKVSPNIKANSLRLESSRLEKLVANGGRSPRVSLNAGLNTFYTSQSKYGVGTPTFTDRPFGYWYNNGTPVSVFMPYPTYNSYETNSFKSQFEQNLGSSVSLSVSLPLFNAWNVNANIQRSKLGIETNKLALQQANQSLYQEITKAHQDFMFAQKKYAASKNNFIANKESYEIAQQQFEMGQMGITDYLNTKSNYIMAQTDFTQAKYNLIFRKKLIDFYLGKELN
jgi:outer membrane protein